MYRPGARPLDGEAPVLVGVVVPVELPLSAPGLIRHRDYAGFGCRLLVGVQDHAFDLTAGTGEHSLAGAFPPGEKVIPISRISLPPSAADPT